MADNSQQAPENIIDRREFRDIVKRIVNDAEKCLKNAYATIK